MSNRNSTINIFFFLMSRNLKCWWARGAFSRPRPAPVPTPCPGAQRPPVFRPDTLQLGRAHGCVDLLDAAAHRKGQRSVTFHPCRNTGRRPWRSPRKMVIARDVAAPRVTTIFHTLRLQSLLGCNGRGLSPLAVRRSIDRVQHQPTLDYDAFSSSLQMMASPASGHRGTALRRR